MWFFALTQELWGWIKSLIGNEALDAVLDKTGLRDFKNRYWRFEKRMPDGNLIRFRDADRCIMDEIYDQRAYGDPALLKEGDVVIDVGGHIGVFAMMAARRVGSFGKVLVFEPGGDNLRLLRANVRMNQLRQVSVYDCALGDREGEAELYLAGRHGNPAANTLIAGPGRRAVKVPLTTLDETIMEVGLSRIDHLKIDVEGAELLVLKGAPESLAITRRIIMEVHPEKLNPQAVLDLLKSAGFRPEVLSQKPHSWLVEAWRQQPTQ